MDGNRRTTFTFGSLLVLLGGWFLAVQFWPDLNHYVAQYFDWPWYVIGVGMVFFAASLLSGVAGLSVPGFIIMGIGGILYYTNATNDWKSWAYIWPFILVSIGIGILVKDWLEGKFRRGLREGGNLVIIGLVFFLIFGSFMRPIFGESPLFGDLWPVALIVIGVWMLVRSLLPKKKKEKKKITVIKDDTIPAEVVAAVVEISVDAEEDMADEIEASVDIEDATDEEAAE